MLVDEDVNEVEIKVTPNDSKSAVSIENNTGLKPGLNKVIVQITSESGATNEYLFNVYKIGEEPKKEETIVEEPIKEEPIQPEQKEEKFNIWIIIAGIELLLIIILVVLLKKNRSKDNKLDNNKQFVQWPHTRLYIKRQQNEYNYVDIVSSMIYN